MKSKALRLVFLCLLLFGIAAGLRFWLAPGLPRIKLGNGAEFQVLQIGYGDSRSRAHDCAPTGELNTRLWNSFPSLHGWLNEPRNGMKSHLPSTRMGNYLTLWWELRDRGELNLDSVRVTGDSGETVIARDAGTHFGNDQSVAKFVRVRILPDKSRCGQVYIPKPPRNSRHLHFSLFFGKEAAEFMVANPAYEKP